MNFHPTQTDKYGRNLDRKSVSPDNQFIPDKDFGLIPFRAVVVAYYAKSQKVDVIYPQIGGTGFLADVDVYGSHGNLLGTVHSPDIAVQESKDVFGYNLDPDKDENGQDLLQNKVTAGDKKNNIECIIQKTTTGFMTSEFRALNPDNPMWLNSKRGRRIVSHDGGSYNIYDKDGNHEFIHCSGLRIKIGDSPGTIVMDEPMPVHLGNKLRMLDATNLIVEHPSGSKVLFDPDGGVLVENSGGGKIGLDSTGKVISENSVGKVGVKIGAIIDEINKIIVAQGTGPDIVALTQLKTDILDILG